MMRLRLLGSFFIVGGLSLIIALALALDETLLNAIMVGLAYVLTLAIFAARWVRLRKMH